jgi:hypothetical protein
MESSRQPAWVGCLEGLLSGEFRMLLLVDASTSEVETKRRQLRG